MGKYWIKILIAALLIFGVGFTAFATGRSFVRNINSDHDLTIPLGSFIPFNVSGEKLGTIRSLTIQRSAPKQVTGFGIRARLTDSAAMAQVKDCRISVTDPDRIDERTMFFCLKSDSGYQVFGEVRLELRSDGDMTTIVQPLLLPDATVADIRRKGSENTSGEDSMATEIRERVRIQTQAISDSIRAGALEERAQRMKQQAESLRARSVRRPPTP